MHGNGTIAQHRLGPCCRDNDELAGRIGDGVFDVPEMALHLDVFDFEIGHSGLQTRIPIDQPLVLVNQALFVQLNKHFQNGAAEPIVHREAFAAPIGGGTKTA